MKRNVRDIAAGPQAAASNNSELTAVMAKIAELETKSPVTAEQVTAIVTSAVNTALAGIKPVTEAQVITSVRQALEAQNIDGKLTAQEQKLVTMLQKPENAAKAEAFVGTFFGTKEGMEKTANLFYGGGDLRTARQLAGTPLDDGWVSDIKCAGATNLKMWHLPILLTAGGLGYVALKKVGFIDYMVDLFDL